MCLAVPGQVTEIVGDGELRSARIDFGGVAREASLIFVPEAGSGLLGIAVLATLIPQARVRRS